MYEVGRAFDYLLLGSLDTLLLLIIMAQLIIDILLGNFSLIINRKRKAKTNIMFGNYFSILIRAFKSYALIGKI